MSSFINTNINSLIAQQNLAANQSSLTTSITRLSSGLRINSAADDPAGLAIANRMTSQVNGTNMAVLNANNGISLAQTADGAMASTVSALQQIRTLAVEAANATNSASDRQSLNAQANALLAGIQQTALTTQFNGQNLLDGSFGTATFQVGANANQTVSMATGNFQTSQYGVQQAYSAAFTSQPGMLGTTASPRLASQGYSFNPGGLGIKGSFVINGQSTQTVNLTATDNAATAAAAINALEAQTGVTATAQNISELNFSNADPGAYTLLVQGDNMAAVNVTFNLDGAASATTLAGAVQAFNSVSGQTGITATLNAANNGLVLTNAAGNNIGIGMTSAPDFSRLWLGAYDAGTSATTGVQSFVINPMVGSLSVDSPAAVTSGTLQFSSSKGFSIDASSTSALVSRIPGGGNFGYTPPITSSLNALNTIDLSTAEGATRALAIVDGAISTVDAQRAQFGAIQAQFGQIVSNLQTTSTNLQSARSQIQDTDFASETANLSRTQILQQAGTAMIAQANQLPQTVLALLK